MRTASSVSRARERSSRDRAYHTYHGLWRYFTVDDDQLREADNYLMIGTLEAYRKLQEYFGMDRLLPVMVELEDGAAAPEGAGQRTFPGMSEVWGDVPPFPGGQRGFFRGEDSTGQYRQTLCER